MKKTHERKLIRDEIVTRLKAGKTLAKEKIFSNAAVFIRDEELPAMYVNSLSEDVREFSESPKKYLRNLDLIVECYGIGSDQDNVQDQLDQLSLEVENILGKGDFLGLDFVNDIDLTRVDFQFEPDGRQIIGAVKNVFRVEYLTEPLQNAEDDESRCVTPFTGSDVSWNINKKNDADDPSGEKLVEAKDKIDN